MATRASNSNNSIVRKKVTPSSNSCITPKPTNIIRPATIASSASKVKTTTTTTTTPTSSGKSVPNYLKPTSSSRPESSNLAKKNINEDDTQKLLRRRSFDKAPSTTKSLVSPNPKERVVSRDRRLPNRSASFSPSSSSSSRIPTLTTEPPVLDRNSKFLKPSKPQPGTITGSSSFTRTTSLSKNSNNVSHLSKGSNDPHDAIQDMDMEAKQESDKESSSVQEAEETVLNVEREEEVQSDMQKAENKEDVDGDGEEVKPSEISVVAEEPKILEEDSNGNELHEVGGEEEENHSNDQAEEGIKADEAKAELTNKLDKGGENTNWDEKFKAASPEEAVEDEKKKEEREEVKCKEGEDVVVVEENGEGEEEANVVQQKRQVVQAKKESPAAYNDVIEETKNKLLEKRKNKVKALVGAFETVIDYETAGSNK